MIFRQLFDAGSSTYTYLVADERTRKAVLIDPVFEQHARDAALLRELSLTLTQTLDTHCHADHVTGAWLMKRALGAQIGLASAYGAENVDKKLTHGDAILLGDLAIEVRATPGHTSGCLSFVMADRVFTGDALLVRGAGRTDFQGGDAATLYRSIQTQLFTLPRSHFVYPAHDYEGRTMSTIGEERAHNPRIGGAAQEQDFVGYMGNLALPHPKQLAVALPANLRSGRPENEHVAPKWGPVVMTYAGVPEIASEWVAAHLNEVQVIDVRTRSEFENDSERITGAKLIPLDELRGRLSEIGDERPVVLVCESGRRSSLGAAILVKAGHKRVANMAGGMILWRDFGGFI